MEIEAIIQNILNKLNINSKKSLTKKSLPRLKGGGNFTLLNFILIIVFLAIIYLTYLKKQRNNDNALKQYVRRVEKDSYQTLLNTDFVPTHSNLNYCYPNDPMFNGVVKNLSKNKFESSTNTFQNNYLKKSSRSSTIDLKKFLDHCVTKFSNMSELI